MPTALLPVLVQAAGAAAEGLAQAAAGVATQLDVFGGNWLLDALFWGVLLVTAYSIAILAPRQ